MASSLAPLSKILSMDQNSISTYLDMSTSEALTHTDLRDTMKSQFSGKDVDFFEYHFHLKMIDIKKLDRLYLQTTFLPYYVGQANFSSIKENRSTKKVNVKKSTQVNLQKENTSDMTQCVNPTYDVVFGDCIESHLYLVYKKSESHLINKINNLVLSKLKTDSLVPCSTDPKSKIIIKICKNWFRGIVTAWPPRFPDTVLIKLVDLGRYVDVDITKAQCYKCPDDIDNKCLSFHMQVDKNVNVGCIAKVEQLNSMSPVEAKIVHEIGIEDNGIPLGSVEMMQTKNKIDAIVVLPLNIPLNVNMLSREKDYYWAQDQNFINIYEKWYDMLESNTDEFTEMPQCGQYCLKKYEQVWCRAIVQSRTPLKIFYIDYGNEEVVSNFKDLKPMPEICLSYQPFAFKVKWAKENNCSIGYEYEQEMTVIPVEKLDDNIYEVLRLGESLEDWKYLDKPISIVGGNFELSKALEVYVLDKTKEFLVVLASAQSKGNLYNNISLLANVDDSHDINYENITEGDYVLVFDTDSSRWLRAQLIDQNNSIFYLIDSGKDCKSPKKMKSLLNHMCDLPPRVVKIQINLSLLKLCDIQSVIEILPINLSDKNTLVSKLLLSSKFALESPPPLPLNEKITAYFSHTDNRDKTISYFFIAIDNKFESIINSIHRLIASSSKLTQINVDDYCGIFQEDTFCRAKILKVSKDKVTVFLIDTGEIDIVNASECLELPDEVYHYPPIIVSTKPLDPVFYLDLQAEVTLIPREEIERRIYSVNIVLAKHET